MIYIAVIDVCFVYCFIFFLTRKIDRNSNVSTILSLINFDSQIDFVLLVLFHEDDRFLNQQIFSLFLASFLKNETSREYEIRSAILFSSALIF